MITRILVSLLFCYLFLPASQAQNQPAEEDQVFLVLVEVQKAADIARCYTKAFDKKQVAVEFAFEDTINHLADFIYEEDPLIGPDCFVPDLKMVFRDYTYVISLYCSKVIRYKNAQAFVASPTRIKNDLVITESVLRYLTRLKKHYLQADTPNPNLISKVVTSEPFEELKEDEAVLELLLNEDWLEEDEEGDLPLESDRVFPEEEEEPEFEEEIPSEESPAPKKGKGKKTVPAKKKSGG